MLEEIKRRVCDANLRLWEHGLVTLTWGNVSEIDRERGLMVIKPSGVAYGEMRPEQMVVTDLDGRVVEGDLRPSTDAPTHLCLYRAFADIGGVCHTHSEYATCFAQARRAIPCYGTTSADYFYGPVPCARSLTDEEIAGEYEWNTGLVIAEAFREGGIDPLAVPAVLVSGHGPFTWGRSGAAAVENALVLEACARMALHSELLDSRIQPAEQGLLDKHYFRKHGADAYYGQGAGEH